MKKVLILTVTAGNGHNACAKAMKQKLEQEEGVEVKIVDLLKSYSSSFDIWMADKGYNIAIGKFRHIYNLFYNYYYNQSPSKRYRCKAQASAMSTVCGLLREIYTYQPDVIYCVHFYGAIALTDLKLAYNVPCKTIVANLDYVNGSCCPKGQTPNPGCGNGGFCNNADNSFTASSIVTCGIITSFLCSYGK